MNVNNVKNNDYNERIIELFKKYSYKKLPKNGWIQYCFYCGDVTSNIIEYRKIKKEYDKYIINVYLCNICHKKYKTNDIDNDEYNGIIEKINKFLIRHKLYYCDDYI